MSLLSSRPALRWAVPAGVLAAAVVVGGAGSLLRATAAPALPERTAEQLLVDLQTAKIDGFSGTVVQKAELGLPELPNIGAQGSSDLNSLVSGAHTLRVWYAGPTKVRIALLGTLGESDVIRNGADLWVWNSQENKASHRALSVRDEAKRSLDPSGKEVPHPLPSTPQEAADQALAAIDPTTKVVTDGTATVAGRSAYELVLSPKDTASKIGQVRLAIDGERYLPLRVQVFAQGATSPAFEVGFTQLSLTKPGDEQFRFVPPPKATVTEEGAVRVPRADHPGTPGTPDGTQPGGGPTVIGTGWTSVLVMRDAPAAGAAAKKADRKDLRPDGAPAEPGSSESGLWDVISQATKPVSGAWGSGRLLESKLFSVLLTDDGRTLIGAVSPARLYAAASVPAAAVKAPATPKAPR